MLVGASGWGLISASSEYESWCVLLGSLRAFGSVFRSGWKSSVCVYECGWERVYECVWECGTVLVWVESGMGGMNTSLQLFFYLVSFTETCDLITACHYSIRM